MESKGKLVLKKFFYMGSKGLFTALLWPYFRVRVRGREHLPRKGALLLAANHASYADPLILGTFLHRRLWFVMAEDQFAKPLLKSFSRLMDVIPVQAGPGFRLGSLRKCLTILKGGHAVAIFPEGRRSRTGTLLPPMPGIGALAARTGAPIVPVAIAGTREAYPPGRRFPSPGQVTLFVGAPLSGLEGLSADAVAQKAMEAIGELLVQNGFGDYVENGG